MTSLIVENDVTCAKTNNYRKQFEALQRRTFGKIKYFNKCSGVEITAGHHCGGETFQSIFSLFGWKYPEKSLLYSDDRVVISTPDAVFWEAFRWQVIFLAKGLSKYTSYICLIWSIKTIWHHRVHSFGRKKKCQRYLCCRGLNLVPEEIKKL